MLLYIALLQIPTAGGLFLIHQSSGLWFFYIWISPWTQVRILTI
jgi:hypothetical protein